jgi:inhibitor of cysteine peptidase
MEVVTDRKDCALAGSSCSVSVRVMTHGPRCLCKLTFLALALAIALPCGIATADLCPNCSNLMFTDSVGTCTVCGAATASGALKICSKCSRQRQQCEHCLGSLAGGPMPPPSTVATPPSAGTKPSLGETPIERLPPAGTTPNVNPRPSAAAVPSTPAPIDAERGGAYASGRWKYQLELTDSGTRSEGKWGSLWYDQRRLPRGDVNDYYRTPWGPLYWVGSPQTRWGLHGWMPMPSPQSNRRGRALNQAPPPAVAPSAVAAAGAAKSPAAGAAQPLQLTRTDNGRRFHVTAGHTFEVRLAGNPTTGYRWQAATTQGQSVRLAAEPTYLAQPHAQGVVGVGGTFVFRFQAVQAGTSVIRLIYVRPWEKNASPAAVFTATLDIYPPSRQATPGTR